MNLDNENQEVGEILEEISTALHFVTQHCLNKDRTILSLGNENEPLAQDQLINEALYTAVNKKILEMEEAYHVNR